MAKFFRILVGIIIAVCLLAVAALLVPPIVGVKTEVSGPEMDTNLVEGTVTYGVRRPSVILQKGDQIVFSDETSLYLYDVEDVNVDTGDVTVTDPATSEEKVLQIKKNATKKVLVIPYLGYILLALRSSNGLPMLISAAVFLAALYVITVLWDKKRKNAKAAARVHAEEDEEYFTALARSVDQPSQLDQIYKNEAQTAQEAARSESLPTTEIPSIPGTAASFEEVPDGLTREISLDAGGAAAAAVGTAAASEAMTEILEQDTIPDLPMMDKEDTAVTAEQEKKEKKAVIKPVKDHAEKDVKEDKKSDAAAAGIAAGSVAAGIALAAASRKDEEEPEEIPEKPEPDRFNTDNISEAFSNVPDDNSPATLDINENELPDVSVALVAALETTQVSRSERTYPARQAEPEPEEEELDEVELAIPVRTANEILDEAYAKGKDPQVITDDVTGVKLVDFSDCF